MCVTCIDVIRVTVCVHIPDVAVSCSGGDCDSCLSSADVFVPEMGFAVQGEQRTRGLQEARQTVRVGFSDPEWVKECSTD